VGHGLDGVGQGDGLLGVQVQRLDGDAEVDVDELVLEVGVDAHADRLGGGRLGLLVLLG
jgi:hypothetical protein